MATRLLTKIIAVFICLTALSYMATAQQSRYDQIAYRIDSLANIGLPKSALVEVNKLDSLARKNNNAPQQIRAAVYRMTFQSYLEESALETIITRLKIDIDRATYPVKPVLQSLLGQMYGTYYQQNRYLLSQRSTLVVPDSDFTNWDLRTIINETSRLYEVSLADAKKEQNTPISVLEGVLEGDSASRYLRPTLYDLLVHRAFDFFLTNEAGLSKPKLSFSLNDPRFFGNDKTFSNIEVKTSDTGSLEYKGIKYLQQATVFHLRRGDEEALADLNMKRLKFLQTNSTNADKDSLYVRALSKITVDFSDKPISADAWVLLGQYYQQVDSLNIAYNYFVKAASAYPKSVGGKNATSLIGQIGEKQLSAHVEETNIPGKPILSLLEYKNLTAARFKIYHLSEDQLYKFSYESEPPLTQNEYKKNYLKKLTPVQIQTVSWVNLNDFKQHSLEFKIDSLKPGSYVLLLSDTIKSNDTLASWVSFRVSSIAYTARVNPDEQVELRIMDRQTGAPLPDAEIHLSARTAKYNSNTKTNDWVDINADGVSDRDGFFKTDKFTSQYNISVRIVSDEDTLTNRSGYIYGARDDSDDSDDPEDKTVIFTDRQIYRPGQTIYFKALQLQSFKSKSKLMPNKHIDVGFYNVNGQLVSSLNLFTNDFGTANGSFIVPQDMLGGEVSLKTNDGSLWIKVEEYKRPTFQAELLPVKESHKLNDSITVNGNATAFSGYGISQARVVYRIVRSQNNEVYYNGNGRQLSRLDYNSIQTEISSDTVTSDDQGSFKIKFKASAADSTIAKSITYNYAISVDVTDQSGETRSAETTVVVGNNDIRIDGDIPAQLVSKDSVTTLIKIKNLNGRTEKGKITVEVYALKDPGRMFKKRLWKKPDQFIINGLDFSNYFPDYAYKSEDVMDNWPKLNKVISQNIDLNADTVGIVNFSPLGKQPSGIYRVVINAQNAKGDTTSVNGFVDVISGPSRPLKFEDWVIPLITDVKPGDTAQLLVGTGEKANVLMERYNGVKLVSSKWLTLEKGQKRIGVRIGRDDINTVVQFLMVYQNRMYSSYQKISIYNPEKDLKIKFMTFHDKLQPGQKDQWALQVTSQGKEKQAAEMVADMYDASLDDITPAQDWQNALIGEPGYQPNYFMWNAFNFLHQTTTELLFYLRPSYPLLFRSYEHLNLFGYNYYGGYNTAYRDYLNKTQRELSSAKFNEQLEKDYLRNAVLIKHGYDITGKVIALDDKLPIPGVSIKIKGSNIGTMTNSGGYFKIRVPIDATLIFSYVGFETFEMQTNKAAKITVTLKAQANQLGEVVVTGALGIKTQPRQLGYATATVLNKSLNEGRMTDAATGLSGKVTGLQINSDGTESQVSRIILRGNGVLNNPTTPRTNFNETAFFYPQLHTDEKGQILIDFTIPEALTRWKFRGLAHTRDLESGYIEAEVVTQKQLSISANTPRFLREGDTITISARLANLTADKLKGKVRLQLFNAVNMQPVNLFVDKADAEQDFKVDGNTNKAVSFKLAIPFGLDALDYRLTADAGEFTDGEENTLPVLPNRMLVTESMPMMVRAGQTKDFTFSKLVNQHSATLQSKTLTLEYTSNPAWYAVQALPYMMEFPYECSEQTFSRYFANSLATDIVNKNPVIKKVFEQWKQTNSTELLSNLEKNQELKSTLIEETPWLRDAENETEQKKRIALLFDLNKMSDELRQALDKLQKRQLPDGGFTWFGGDEADRYITQHIVEGMGELHHLHINDSVAELQQMAGRAIDYLDGQLLKDERERKKVKDGLWFYGDLEIYAWFARSFYTDHRMSPALHTALNNYMKWAESNWTFRNAYEQGMIALTMQRFGKSDVTAQIEKSLLETAQQSDELGMYWAKNQLGYYWYESPVETQSLLIELFTEVGENAKAVDEMKIWLLRNKQTNDWKTTKATAAACYALLLKGSSLLADTGATTIKLGGKPLQELKPDAKADAGTGYLKTSWQDEQIKPELGKVEIKNNGKTVSWGALHWQYLENLDKITSANTNIRLRRKYFIQKQTDAGAVLTEVDATHQPKVGDLLKVVVYLDADRDFEYVQLKDMRPAGTEPVDALSTYKYQDGLWYYQVTKDVATNFFISELPKGSFVFEYRLRVAQPGNFSTGITGIQCMYAPGFNAHSEGGRIVVKP